MRSGSTGGGQAEESGGGEQDHRGEDADQEQALIFVDRLMSCFEYHQGCNSGLFLIVLILLPFVKLTDNNKSS